MADRPRILDDLAGVAGGAISALAGLRDEAGSVARARAEELIHRLNLVKREELDVAMEMAANARAGQEALTARLVEVLDRLAALEARLAAQESKAQETGAPEPKAPSGGGPGMMA